MYKYLFFSLLLVCFVSLFGQQNDTTITQYDYPQINTDGYATPSKYVVAEILVSGAKYYNTDQIINISELSVGDTITIPGDAIVKAMSKLWKNGLFADISLRQRKIEGDKIYLEIVVVERPRIISYSFEGIRKGDIDDLKEKLTVRRGSEVSDYLLRTSEGIIKKHFEGKGYASVNVKTIQRQDTTILNGVRLVFKIDRGKRVRVKLLEFEGNVNVKSSTLRKAMKKIHRISINFFQSTKYIQKDLEEDKLLILEKYQELGYRDAKILGDSIWFIKPNRVGVKIKVYEGQRYYFRNIEWVGNAKYPDAFLNAQLRVKKGDIYDKITLEKRLNTDENSISTLYMDEGHLFFQAIPVEVKIDKDSIDLEIRIHEGKPATINKINIIGNTKTNEHVIRREIWTKPGNLFSKSDIIRTVRELATMGHFDPEKITPTPQPNQADETVDITYTLEEKPNDQLELSGGWGQGLLVFSVGVKFTNFSAGRIFEKDAWRPVPSGDNQQLTIRAQSNGTYYTSASISFVEPWLGGKKPTSLSTSLFYTYQDNGTTFNYFGVANTGKATASMQVFGASVGIGQRLKWPDTYFTLYTGIDYQRYNLNNWNYFAVTNGSINNLSARIIFGRNSTDQPIYPRKGSEFAVGLQITPPYSLMSKSQNYDETTPEGIKAKYSWIEYHKWTFTGKLFTSLVGDLVLATRVQTGILGYFNKNWGYSPFEGFVMGGDGMSGYNYYGADIIGLRGYKNNTLTPTNNNGVQMARAYVKYTLELRYPAILSPQSTIYGLVFFEAGNSWNELKDYNPFSFKRSVGVGVRLMLPMVGLLGVDWGYGFDKVSYNSNAGGPNFHFVLGMPF